jgi:hypothetical protein
MFVFHFTQVSAILLHSQICSTLHRFFIYKCMVQGFICTDKMSTLIHSLLAFLLSGGLPTTACKIGQQKSRASDNIFSLQFVM